MALRLRIVTGRRRGSPLQRFMVYSLVAHGVAIAAFVLLPGVFGRSRTLDNSFPIVSLVGAAPAVPAAPVEQKPSPVEPEPEPEPPEPPKEDVSLTPKEPVVTDKPKPEPSEPEPRPSPPPPTPTESATAGSAEGGATVAMEGTGDVQFGWYRSAVAAALHSRWKRPLLSGAAQTLEVRVEFEILRDGSVRGLRVAASSGVPTMDRSALRAVADASPLPPLPGNFREPSWVVGCVFRLYPEDF